MEVILVRHASHDEIGRVLSGRSEIALSAQGTAEANALARVLDSRAVSTLHASPRRRAVETAAAIGAGRGLVARISPALDEIDFGAFAGCTFAALDSIPEWQDWNRDRDTARCPGGETMHEAVFRARTYLESLPQSDGPAVCVTHCDIIRGIIATILGLRFAQMFELACDPASFTTIELAEGRARLIALNARAPC
jgi:broad specificity phosphatase PhoE